MSKVTLICGRICSGKSTLARKIQAEEGGVILSCDELMLKLFPKGAGDMHDEIAGRVKAYLYGKAEELLKNDVHIILDWGFWTARERNYVNNFFRERNAEVRWMFTNIDDRTHVDYIIDRNQKVIAGECSDYYVDEGLFMKARSLFQEPDDEEMQTLNSREE